MDAIVPGRYIVAVSGGVDSMVLLDQLRQMRGLDLVVAHVDHGVRPDSNLDCDLVADFAAQHDLRFVSTKLNLGEQASEETARRQRYLFLRQCRKEFKAKAIITAHHQDDLVETAILALLRGTGWRGLAPFVESADLVRPLLHMPKQQLIGYARAHHIPWREDSTNQDEHYLRNFIRHSLIPLCDQKSDSWRDDFLQLIRKQQLLRQTIHSAIAELPAGSQTLRFFIIMAPPEVAYELVQEQCKKITGNTVQRRVAEAAVVFIKVARPRAVLQLSATHHIRVTQREFIVEPRTP